MILFRKSSERGYADHGWLHSHHSFSFADYFDAAQMGWGSLRVINEDSVEPGQGFATHGHRDMEIISYVLSGQLQHRDSIGNGTVIQPGDVQRMSAGSGVQHSEFNPSADEVVHFLQIWITPEARGTQPSYEERFFPPEEKRGRLRLVASRDGREGSVTVGQDVDLYAGLLAAGEQVLQRIADRRLAYLHLVHGALQVNGVALQTGDAVKIEAETQLLIKADEDSELLFFDMA